MNMKTKPWYVALGNHDYDGSPEAEISYHNKNLKWNMPARYYTRIERIGDGGSARLIFVDTTPFERSSSQDTTRQKSWLDSLSARNDTDWVFVIGHHQVYSGGLRKFDRSPIRYAFEPIFNKNGVDIYFCGHEHDLQHMKVAGKPTHYFLSGAGSDIRSTGMMEHSLFAASVQGFMSVTVKKQTLEVKVIDHNGNMLYSTTLEH
jgi:tartrate-resistant acid phosphatase type 5